MSVSQAPVVIAWIPEALAASWVPLPDAASEEVGGGAVLRQAESFVHQQLVAREAVVQLHHVHVPRRQARLSANTLSHSSVHLFQAIYSQIGRETREPLP